MEIFKTRIIDILSRTHNVKSFRISPKEGLNFQAGQFMGVILNINGEEQTKYLSFSSSPTETGYWEFTKRITSSDFSQALDQLKPGNILEIKMPLGNFILDDHQKIAFLSGGIGITPIRSMWKYILDKNLPHDLVLIYGNQTQEEIAFKDDFDSFVKIRANHRIIYTLDKPPKDPGNWHGKIGFINADMIREEIPDFAQRKFYVCGPPQMVECIIKILKAELSIPHSSITKENFTGY